MDRYVHKYQTKVPQIRRYLFLYYNIIQDDVLTYIILSNIKLYVFLWALVYVYVSGLLDSAHD